jgi:hypothetical protein
MSASWRAAVVALDLLFPLGSMSIAAMIRLTEAEALIVRWSVICLYVGP